MKLKHMFLASPNENYLIPSKFFLNWKPDSDAKILEEFK